MARKLLRIKETIATVVADEEYFPAAEKAILSARADIELFIARDPFFQATFEPYSCPADAPAVVKTMCDAAKKANVGPMAAVAGAIAQEAAKAMAKAGARHAIVDNGGDIALYLEKPVTIGIYAGESKIQNLGLRIEPTGGIIGVCTSSGTVGPSISLGNASAATVVAKDVALADAAATALGNIIKKDDPAHIETQISGFTVEGIDGVIVVTESHMGARGSLPQFVRSNVEYDLISKG